jgi:hypothetical protein
VTPWILPSHPGTDNPQIPRRRDGFRNGRKDDPDLAERLRRTSTERPMMNALFTLVSRAF